MTPPQPWFWPQSQTSYGRMYTMMGSIDFATKLKITPQNLIPGFGPFYRTTLLISFQGVQMILVPFFEIPNGDRFTINVKSQVKD